MAAFSNASATLVVYILADCCSAEVTSTAGGAYSIESLWPWVCCLPCCCWFCCRETGRVSCCGTIVELSDKLLPMSYFTTIETGTCTCFVDPSMMLSTSLTWWGPTILGMCIHLSHCDWNICLMPLAAFLDLANMVEGTTVWSRSCRGQVTMTRFASPVALTISPKVANFLLK